MLQSAPRDSAADRRVDGALSPAGVARLESHLRGCDRCVTHEQRLAQAHGTRYQLTHDPFVAFDIMREDQRALFDEFTARMTEAQLAMPKLLFMAQGQSFPIAQAMQMLVAGLLHDLEA